MSRSEAIIPKPPERSATGERTSRCRGVPRGGCPPPQARLERTHGADGGGDLGRALTAELGGNGSGQSAAAAGTEGATELPSTTDSDAARPGGSRGGIGTPLGGPPPAGMEGGAWEPPAFRTEADRGGGAGPDPEALRGFLLPPTRPSDFRNIRGPNGPVRGGSGGAGGAFPFFTASFTTNSRPINRFPWTPRTAAAPNSGSRIMTMAKPRGFFVFGSTGMTRSSIGA
jgi:hypothetical protein